MCVWGGGKILGIQWTKERENSIDNEMRVSYRKADTVSVVVV